MVPYFRAKDQISHARRARPGKDGGMSIGILIADDHKLLREGVRALISEQPDMQVIAEAEDGASAEQLAAKLLPDVIIMDISMPGLNGIDATRNILGANPAARVIALSMHVEIGMVLEMISAGAKGYLLKDCAFEEVTQAVQEVAAGRIYLSSKIADLLLAEYTQQFPKDNRALLQEMTESEREMLSLVESGRSAQEIAALLQVNVKKAEACRLRVILAYILPQLIGLRGKRPVVETVKFTSRERDILVGLREGKTTGEMSAVLGISQDTVKFHLKNIFYKLNVTSRSQAIAVVMKNNYFTTYPNG